MRTQPHFLEKLIQIRLQMQSKSLSISKFDRMIGHNLTCNSHEEAMFLCEFVRYMYPYMSLPQVMCHLLFAVVEHNIDHSPVPTPANLQAYQNLEIFIISNMLALRHIY